MFRRSLHTAATGISSGNTGTYLALQASRCLGTQRNCKQSKVSRLIKDGSSSMGVFSKYS